MLIRIQNDKKNVSFRCKKVDACEKEKFLANKKIQLIMCGHLRIPPVIYSFFFFLAFFVRNCNQFFSFLVIKTLWFSKLLGSFLDDFFVKIVFQPKVRTISCILFNDSESICRK